MDSSSLLTLLQGLSVVLVKTRFPENIGMTARACANMGCSTIRLVTPERWGIDRARILATPKGEPLLEAITLHDSIGEAVASAHYVVGTTARRGGWRRQVLTPREAAQKICSYLNKRESVSILFGPEDRGLENTEISVCQDLITIPTVGLSSLNLAQSVLLVLYECANSLRSTPEPKKEEQSISHDHFERFLSTFKQTLLDLDCLHGDNVDYFFLRWRHLFGKASLTQKECNALLGLCRQIQLLVHKTTNAESNVAKNGTKTLTKTDQIATPSSQAEQTRS